MRALVLAAVIACGRSTPPGPGGPVVQVVTTVPGTDAATIERTITIPLERALAGVPTQTRIRSVTGAGISVITLDISGDVFATRQDIFAKLATVTLPPLVLPELGPLTRPDGVVVRYVLRSRTQPPGKLRELQDWTISRKLLSVVGVADVSTLGGVVQRVNIMPDPARLDAMHLTVDDVVRAIVATKWANQHRATTIEELRSSVIASLHDVPLRLGDVATVEDGYAPRASYVGDGAGEVVEGVVWLRAEGDRSAVRAAVEHALADLRATLPDVELTIVAGDAASGTLVLPSGSIADQATAVRALTKLAPNAVFELGLDDGGFFAGNRDEVQVRFASAEAKTAFAAAVANVPGTVWIGDDTAWIELAGDDLAAISDAAKTIPMPVLERVGTEQVPVVVPHVDVARAARLDVAVDDAWSTIGYGSGYVVGDVELDGEHRVDVAVVVDPRAAISVRNRDGTLVPITAIATYTNELVPREILRDRSQRRAAVRVKGDAAQARAALANVRVPPGVTVTVAAPRE